MIEKKFTFSKVTVSGEGIPEISPEETMANGRHCRLIDVRRPDEFIGELGHVDGAQLCTLESEFEAALGKFNKEDTFVFICRSGARSGHATLMALQCGFKNVYNMSGGMLSWNEKRLPTVR
jgi:rhodanese-related sulfurtransferase